MEIETALVESDLEIYNYFESNDDSSDINQRSGYSSGSDQYPMQTPPFDNLPSLFIEPEVIIKEFSVENLQALKNTRFVKAGLRNCPVCDKHFQRNSHLKRHLLIHTKEKPFQCDICGRSFNQSSSMKSHKQSVHSNDKPFICTEQNCTKSFSNIANLRVHQKSHLPNKEFTCKHCERTFKYVNSLKSHEKMHVFDIIDF
jgi:hypothetical protein